jgi:CRP-like cAMP-binding protein
MSSVKNENIENALTLIYQRAYDVQNPYNSLKDLLPVSSIINVKKHDTILYQGDIVEYLYILLTGKAAVLNSASWGYEIIVDFVEPLHILGFVEHLNNIEAYTAHVVAETTCCLLKISAADFSKMIKSNVDLCYQTLLLQGECTLANMYRSEMKCMIHSRDILGNHLYHLVGTNPLPYIYPYTRQSLSAELHINLRTLYRYMSTLKNQGYLSLNHGKIMITDENYKNLHLRYNELIL